MKLTTIMFAGAALLVMPAAAIAATDAGMSSQASAQTGSMGANASDSIGASAVSSVPDTEKKYKAANRNSDFQKEAEITRQLNQQVASAGGVPKPAQ